MRRLWIIQRPRSHWRRKQGTQIPSALHMHTHQPSQWVLTNVAPSLSTYICTTIMPFSLPFNLLHAYVLNLPLFPSVSFPSSLLLPPRHCVVYRYLLHQDKKREVRRNRERGLTNSAQQLRQNIRNNEVAKLAVTAMATAAKNVKGDNGKGRENPAEEGAQMMEGGADSCERSQRSSDASLVGGILSRLKRGSRVAPSPKESVCSEDAQSDHSTAIVERFRRLLELQHQQPIFGDGGGLDSPDQEARTRAQSFDESIGTPSLANTSISAAERWQFASAALSSERGSLSCHDRRPMMGGDAGYEPSPSKLVHSLKWPNARDVASMGSGLSSLYSDDNSQVSDFAFEDNMLEEESLL